MQYFDVLSQWVMSMTLGMARMYPCMLLVPIFSFHELKGMLRYALVIIMSLMVAPGIKDALPDDGTWTSFAGLYAKEAILGMLLGTLLGIPFWLYESVGSLFDNQRGALMGGQLNPALGQNETSLGFLIKQTVIVLFVVTGAFLSLLQVIWDSYLLWPPTAWLPIPAPDAMDVYQGLLSTAFHDVVLYAAPLVGLLLLIEFGMAILSLYAPQMQAFVLAMPLKCLVGLGFLVLYTPTLLYLAQEKGVQFTTFQAVLKQMFKLNIGE
ncbi:type III secretion system export apparatus subunit SctT [Pokkaliibacter sp. CJK22405]|uniref:type III secretion system export apparatus subunit SctT n=1 Tax=Pokkaliibacter sp. CJK22405 TaxID=3384615 RepID=UPI003984ADF7